MSKSVPIGIAVVVVLGAAALWWAPMPMQNTPEPVLPTMESYSSATSGLAFQYPAVYTLEERADGFEGQAISVITLIPKGVEIPDYSEGPAGIAVLAVPNSANIPLEEWVRTKSISNFALSSNQVLVPTTIDGTPALSYTYSGLYENDAVAVAHSGKVYLFFGAWLTAGDAIRTDFKRLLESVNFEAI